MSGEEKQAEQLSSAEHPCCCTHISELQRAQAECIVVSRALAISRGETSACCDQLSGSHDNTCTLATRLSTVIDRQLEASMSQLWATANCQASSESAALPSSWQESKLALLDNLLLDLASFVKPPKSASSPSTPLQPSDLLPSSSSDILELAVVVEERNLLQATLQEARACQQDCNQRADRNISTWKKKEKQLRSIILKTEAAKSDSTKRLMQECDSLRSEIQYLQARLETRGEGATQLVDGLREEIAHLEIQLRSSKSASCGTVSAIPRDIAMQQEKIEHMEAKISSLREECGALRKVVSNTEVTADRRKCLVDELAIEKQKLADQLSEKEARISSLQSTVCELEALKLVAKTVTDLKEEAESFSTRCKALEQELAHKETQFNLQLHATKEQLQQEFDVELTNMKETLATAESRIAELELQLEVADRAAGDAKATLVIAERKSAAKMKDIRHQLGLESKRVDRLHQEFQTLAILAEQEQEAAGACQSPDSSPSPPLILDPLAKMKRMTSLSTAKFDEILTSLGSAFTPDVPFLRRKTSLMEQSSMDTACPPSAVSSPTAGPALQSSPVLKRSSEQDKYLYKSYSELEGMVRQLTTENRELEDRVHHLEQNASCMADELLEKSAIIRSCVTSDSEKGSKAEPKSSSAFFTSILTPQNAGDLLRRFIPGETSQKSLEADNPTVSQVSLLERRVEEGMVKITHLQQTVRDLMAENEHLRVKVSLHI